MDFLVRRRQSHRALWGLLFSISAFLIIMTFLLRVAGPFPGRAWQFSLGTENNFAAWWSGMLLAISCLFAMDCAAFAKSMDCAKAWISIAGVLLFLSVDEVGSLHERISHVSQSVGAGSWGFLLVLGTIVAFFLVRATVILLRAGGAERRTAIPLLIGFALLGSAALQEFAEHSMEWNGSMVRAARVTLEEGTELIGMLVILAVLMRNSAAKIGTYDIDKRRLFTVLDDHRSRIAVVALIAAPIAALATTAMEDGSGRPADWLSAVAFMAAAAFPVRRILTGVANGTDWSLAAIGVLASLVCVAIEPFGFVPTVYLDISKRLLVLATLCLLACAEIATSPGNQIDQRNTFLLAVAAVMSLLIAQSALLVHLMPFVLALLMFASCAQVCDITRDTTQPRQADRRRNGSILDGNQSPSFRPPHDQTRRTVRR